MINILTMKNKHNGFVNGSNLTHSCRKIYCKYYKLNHC